MAVVNPSYKDDESTLGHPNYLKIWRGFSASMGADLDKVLIAKGLTTTGPFSSLDEITYSQKKDAALTLAPKVFVTAEVQYLGGSGGAAGADQRRMLMMGRSGAAGYGSGDQGTPVQRSVGIVM